MISVEEALSLINKESFFFKKEENLLVSECLGRILAKPIVAPINLPSFRQSVMDGYALCLNDSNQYQVIGEIKAGDSPNLTLKPGKCVRIYTGAAVPEMANAVVMQEKISVKEDYIQINEIPSLNHNIREIGSQIKAGDISLEAGQILNAAGLGFIQSLGIEKLNVYSSLKVSIIVTGNELIPAGQKLEEGKIYESNSLLLQAALEHFEIKNVTIKKVEDRLDATVSAIDKAIKESNIVIVSGGISVGDYDFVGKAMEKLSVDQVFYKVRQRPGKPLFFGIKKETYLFALPGNPASTLSCFYVYVVPLIKKLQGADGKGLSRFQLPITHRFSTKEPRALFLKAYIEKQRVTILDHQNSSMLISFAKSNALVYIPETKKEYLENELVETLILPHVTIP